MSSLSVPAHHARKRFGQNFLHDAAIIQRILQAAGTKPDQSIVEIGPGQGALTLPLLEQGVHLNVIELDRDLVQLFNQQLAPQYIANGQLHITQGDALQIDFHHFGQRINLLGNLPYNVSTPLLFHCLQQLDVIEQMTFMLQKEVVDRIVATCGESDYGRLAVMIQSYCHAEKLFEVGPGAFNPAPKVSSAIVQMRPHTIPEMNEFKRREKFVAQAFSQRRKTLRNTLKPLLSAEQIIAANIDPQRRAETLSLQEFDALLAVWG